MSLVHFPFSRLEAPPMSTPLCRGRPPSALPPRVRGSFALGHSPHSFPSFLPSFSTPRWRSHAASSPASTHHLSASTGRLRSPPPLFCGPHLTNTPSSRFPRPISWRRRHCHSSFFLPAVRIAPRACECSASLSFRKRTTFCSAAQANPFGVICCNRSTRGIHIYVYTHETCEVTLYLTLEKLGLPPLVHPFPAGGLG
jgi:hypothetical protein